MTDLCEFPARNNDVYMVDMERMEMLRPLGTLFGGGAQAGADYPLPDKAAKLGAHW